MSPPLRVDTPDGWSLGVRVHAPREAPRGVVILLHAMMADARSLDRPADRGLASALADRGFEVWRADLRGHGHSGPTPRDGGRWTYDDLVRGDLPALVAAARARGVPVAAVGHSLGAHVSAAAAADGVPLDALVLLAGNVWLPSLEPSRRRRAQKAVVMAGFEAIARGVGHFPSHRLRWGPADEARDYVSDLCRFWWRDRWAAGDGTDWSVAAGRYRRPVLSVAGAGDVLLAHPESARRFADVFPAGAVDFWLAGRGRCGLGHDPDHAGLACDPRCRPVWDRVGDWLVDALGIDRHRRG